MVCANEMMKMRRAIHAGKTNHVIKRLGLFCQCWGEGLEIEFNHMANDSINHK